MFKNKTVFITGGARGIGKAIGLKLATQGANIVITGKSTEPHPKLEGTVFKSAQEMKVAGGDGLGIGMDVRFEDQVKNALEKAAEHFGGIDIVINNASAISLSDVQHLDMKRFDLMHQVNVRGTYMTSKFAIPYLKEADNPHILNLSPPLNFEPKWFGPHLGYSIAKYGMSLCVLGLAEELKPLGIGVNAIWPKTVIATAAVRNLLGGEEVIKRARMPEIVADAAFEILKKKSKETSGNYFIDEEVLKEAGVKNFDKYQQELGNELLPDFFI